MGWLLQLDDLKFWFGSCPEAQAPVQRPPKYSGHCDVMDCEGAPQHLVRSSKSFYESFFALQNNPAFSRLTSQNNFSQNACRNQRKRRGRRAQGRGLPSQHQEHCPGNRRRTDPGELWKSFQFQIPKHLADPPPPPAELFPPQERVRPSQRLPRLRVRPDAHRRNQPLLRPPDRR